MTETEDDLWAEFRTLLNQANCAYYLTRVGLTVWADISRDQHTSAPHPTDSVIELNSGPMPGHGEPVVLAEITRGEQVAAQEPRGLLARQAGLAWLVFVYASWEDNLRKRIADARGINKTDVVHPVLGDLRLIRNDAVHVRALASEENTAKCATLRWFSAGDEIFIDMWMVVEVAEHFGLTKPPPTGPYFELPAR